MSHLLDRDFPALASAAVRRPRQVGTLFPTSRLLAERLVESIDLARVGRLVELGPGSGAVTRVLLERLPPERYVGVEIDPILVDHLRARFPRATFVEGSALRLGEFVADASADHVVSSLPWTLLSRKEQRHGVDGVSSALRPGATFLAYVCVHTFLSPATHTFLALLRDRFTRVTRDALVWRNAPPAAVWRCEARPER